MDLTSTAVVLLADHVAIFGDDIPPSNQVVSQHLTFRIWSRPYSLIYRGPTFPDEQALGDRGEGGKKCLVEERNLGADRGSRWAAICLVQLV